MAMGRTRCNTEYRHVNNKTGTLKTQRNEKNCGKTAEKIEEPCQKINRKTMVPKSTGKKFVEGGLREAEEEEKKK